MSSDSPESESLLRFRATLGYLLFIWFSCWLSNYLLVHGFGLYFDDLPIIADQAKKQLWGVSSSWEWFSRWPQGRPLGWFLLSVLGWPARYFGELIYAYLIAYAILATVASLIFLVVRRKYDALCALLVTLFYLCAPVDLTRIELTINFLAQPALLFALFGIWLYQHGRPVIAYMVSSLALVCYESAYLLFIAAPILAFSVFSWRTWQRQIVHGVICTAIVAAVSALRYFVFASAFVSHGRQAERNLAEALLDGVWLYGGHFFGFLWFGLLRGMQFVDHVSVLVALALLFGSIYLLKKYPISDVLSVRAKSADLLIVGASLFVLGILTSGLADYYPYTAISGRNTRVYLAATIGGGMFCLAPLIAIAWYATRKGGWMNLVPITLAVPLLLALTANSLKMQEDYVNAWKVQKHTVRQSLALACDALPGDVLILEPRQQAWNKGRAIQPYGFGLSTVIADIYDWSGTPFARIPRLHTTTPKWIEGLHLRKDGRLHWDRQRLSGFPVLSNRPLEPGTVIHLVGTWRGVERLSEPVVVEGVNVVKAQQRTESCLFREKELSGPLAKIFFDDYFALRSP